MAVLAQSIISRVRTQLVDTNTANQQWSDTEMLRWLSDGQRTIVAASPSASAIRANITLAAGTKQKLPDDAHLLLDVERNVGGRAIRKADEATIDAFSPDWHAATPTTAVKHYLFNQFMPVDFYVYPPNDGTGEIEVIYSRDPPELTSLNDPLTVTPIYQTALVDYLMFRCHQKDSDYAANSAAQGYLALFQAVFTAGESGQIAQSPTASGAS
jgi:hypothetical protein